MLSVIWDLYFLKICNVNRIREELQVLFVLATLPGIWDLSSPTRDLTCTPSTGSSEDQLLGNPKSCCF